MSRTPDDSGRLPLKAPRAERCLIGAVIEADSRRAKDEDVPDVIAMVDGDSLIEAFSDSKHKAVWELLCGRHHQGLPNDLISASEALKGANLPIGLEALAWPELFGWISDFVDLGAEVVTPFVARKFAAEIRDKWLRREAKRLAQSVIDTVETNPKPSCEFLEAVVSPLAALQIPEQVEESFGDAIMESMRDVERILDARGEAVISGIATGLVELDRHLGGMKPKQFVTVGGRTGSGKTAFALTVALAAATAGAPVIFFSCEMDDVELVKRLLSQLSGVDLARVINGPLTPREHRLIADAAARLSTLPIEIVTDQYHWPKILRRARRAVSKGARLIVIDYIQLLTTPVAKNTPKSQMIGLISNDIKRFASRSNVTAMVLAQLNRDANKEEEPQLHHLKDCGDIEQDSNVVIFPYHSKSCSKGEMALKIAKNRNGPLGHVFAAWRAEIARFENREDDLFDNR